MSNLSLCPNQCRTVKITILGDEGVPVQVDGEAWIQPPGVIKIQHKNRAQMLTRDRVRKGSWRGREGIKWGSEKTGWRMKGGTRDWICLCWNIISTLPELIYMILCVLMSDFPCRHLRTHWSHGRTSSSTISLLWDHTSTLSSLWIWPQRRRPLWCRCVLELRRSSLQGKHGRQVSSDLVHFFLRHESCLLTASSV